MEKRSTTTAYVIGEVVYCTGFPVSRRHWVIVQRWRMDGEYFYLLESGDRWLHGVPHDQVMRVHDAINLDVLGKVCLN